MFMGLQKKRRKPKQYKTLAGLLWIQNSSNFPNTIFMIPSHQKTLVFLILPTALSTVSCEEGTDKRMKMREEKKKRNSSLS
jgi:hypothetical protein